MAPNVKAHTFATLKEAHNFKLVSVVIVEDTHPIELNPIDIESLRAGFNLRHCVL